MENTSLANWFSLSIWFIAAWHHWHATWTCEQAARRVVISTIICQFGTFSSSPLSERIISFSQGVCETDSLRSWKAKLNKHKQQSWWSHPVGGQRQHVLDIEEFFLNLLRIGVGLATTSSSSSTTTNSFHHSLISLKESLIHENGEEFCAGHDAESLNS